MKIAQFEKCSYDKAVDLINTQVNNWKISLENENNILLKNIGAITMNVDKNMVFSPVDNFNYLSSSFGLTSFVSPLVSREVKIDYEF